jgi:hypothetical protein
MKILFAMMLLCGLAVSQTPSTTYKNIEDMSGWTGQMDVWASGNHKVDFAFTQKVASPSMDGNSTQFQIKSGMPYSSVLWHETLGKNTTSKSFTMDYYVWIDNPQAPQTLEVAVLQNHGKSWYKLSTQCNFARGTWRFWSGTGGWNATSAPCPRLKAQSWNHIVMNFDIVNGKSHFISESINGSKHYVNAFAPPVAKSTNSDTLGVHFQMDGNKTEAPFSMWVERMNLSVYSSSGVLQ